jgi:hypothetical protein
LGTDLGVRIMGRMLTLAGQGPIVRL